MRWITAFVEIVLREASPDRPSLPGRLLAALRRDDAGDLALIGAHELEAARAELARVSVMGWGEQIAEQWDRNVTGRPPLPTLVEDVLVHGVQVPA